MAVARSAHPEAFSKLGVVLSQMKDPLHAIALLRDGRTLTPAEFFLIGHLAYSTGKALAAMADAGEVSWPERTVPPVLSAVEKRLLPGSSGQPSFYIADSYSPELARVRAARKGREKALRAEMAEEADAAEKLVGRKVGLREEIAIRKSNAETVEKARLMPELGEVRETVTHVHFRLKATRDAVRLEREINRLRQREAAIEGDILADLSRELAPYADKLEAALLALGELDYLICKAELALEWDAVMPQVMEREAGGALHLREAYHPIVRREVERRGGRFQPLTIELDEPVSVVTGPNMGGKTVSLETVGLCVALAQHGFLVPCAEMSFSPYDFIYFQPGAPGKPGLSSFAEEILSLKAPLARRGQRGLILLDEVGRGTNPSQGLALYAALLRHLRESPEPVPTVMATTHYHGLAALVGAPHWQVAGLSAYPDDGPAEDELPGSADIGWLYRHMDYRLQKVGPDAPTPQDALLVARVLGLDEDIIERAERLVKGGRVKIDDETGF